VNAAGVAAAGRPRATGASRRRALPAAGFTFLAAALAAKAQTPTAAAPPVLSQIDRIVREQFWDPKFNGADWDAAVRRAGGELARASNASERDAAYDRLLAVLSDSHTFRMPAGFPERRWSTAGLRIGREEAGYAVKGVLPGGPADRAGIRVGDRVLAVGGRRYGAERVNFRDLFFVFEGPAASSVNVTWVPAGGSEQKTALLRREPEEPGDALVWKSARVLDREGKKYGYLRLWGVSADTALAVVDLLLDRAEAARSKPELKDWAAIEGVLLDVRGNSGGYDPNILTTFLRGQWSAGDYEVLTREGRRVVPPEYRKLPVALLVNSGTASAGEALALKFRTHGIGPIVGEETAGMLSGGAAFEKLSDGSTLFISRRAIRDLQGRSYEGRGVPPDVPVADRPGAAPGQEDAVVEAAVRALSLLSSSK
jgi:carboxyl-terminal processing protease